MIEVIYFTILLWSILANTVTSLRASFFDFVFIWERFISFRTYLLFEGVSETSQALPKEPSPMHFSFLKF